MYKRFHRWFPVFVLPTLAAFIVAFLIPFAMGIRLSFYRFTTIRNTRFVGWDNYVRALSDGEFLGSLTFSAAFTAVSLLTVNLLAFALALALDIYNTFYGRIGWQGVGQAKAVLFFLLVAVIAALQLGLTRRGEVEP